MISDAKRRRFDSGRTVDRTACGGGRRRTVEETEETGKGRVASLSAMGGEGGEGRENWGDFWERKALGGGQPWSNHRPRVSIK